MNDQKLCESAYLTSSDSERGPALHGAAMIDRTSGTTHIYLIRGKTTDSVVSELHRQLVRTGRLPRSQRRGVTLPSLLLTVGVAVILGALAAFLGPASK